MVSNILEISNQEPDKNLNFSLHLRTLRKRIVFKLIGAHFPRGIVRFGHDYFYWLKTNSSASTIILNDNKDGINRIPQMRQYRCPLSFLY